MAHAVKTANEKYFKHENDFKIMLPGLKVTSKITENTCLILGASDSTLSKSVVLNDIVDGTEGNISAAGHLRQVSVCFFKKSFEIRALKGVLILLPGLR